MQEDIGLSASWDDADDVHLHQALLSAVADITAVAATAVVVR